MSDQSLPQSALRRYLKTGVTGHYQAKAEQGYVLISPLALINKTLLVDMDGQVVHEWNHDVPIGMYGQLTDEGNLFMGGKD